MKKILPIIAISLFTITHANAQMGPGYSLSKKRYGLKLKSLDKKFGLMGYMGVGFGREYLISAPKIAVLGMFQIRKKSLKKTYCFSGSSIYVGLETSMLVYFGGAFGVGANAGIKIGPITLDGSLSKLSLSSPSSEIVARQQTFNPKIGLVLGDAWLKAGPSYLLNGTDILSSFLGGKEFRFNIEIGGVIAF